MWRGYANGGWWIDEGEEAEQDGAEWVVGGGIVEAAAGVVSVRDG